MPYRKITKSVTFLSIIFFNIFIFCNLGNTQYLGNFYFGSNIGVYGLGGLYGGIGYGGYSSLRTIWINGKPQLYNGPPTALEIPPGPIPSFNYGLSGMYDGLGSFYGLGSWY